MTPSTSSVAVARKTTEEYISDTAYNKRDITAIVYKLCFKHSLGYTQHTCVCTNDTPVLYVYYLFSGGLKMS